MYIDVNLSRYSTRDVLDEHKKIIGDMVWTLMCDLGSLTTTRLQSFFRDCITAKNANGDYHFYAPRPKATASSTGGPLDAGNFLSKKFQGWSEKVVAALTYSFVVNVDSPMDGLNHWKQDSIILWEQLQSFVERNSRASFPQVLDAFRPTNLTPEEETLAEELCDPMKYLFVAAVKTSTSEGIKLSAKAFREVICDEETHETLPKDFSPVDYIPFLPTAYLKPLCRFFALPKGVARRRIFTLF